MNNDYTIRGKIDAKLYDALKIILNKKNLTQQTLIETLVKNYVFENLDLVILKDGN